MKKSKQQKRLELKANLKNFNPGPGAGKSYWMFVDAIRNWVK